MKKLPSIFLAVGLAANITNLQASVSTPSAEQPPKAAKPVLYRGLYLERKGKPLFAPCAGGQLRVDDTPAQHDLAYEYAQQPGTKNKRLYAEVRAVRNGRALQVVELRRAYGADGPGCREDLRPIILVAEGNEPPWRVRIDDKGLHFRKSDEKPMPPVEVRAQEPRKDELSYEADTPQGLLRVFVKPELCRDKQTGARYAYRARVELEGKILFGCAYFGELARN